MENNIIFNKPLKMNSYAKINLFLDVIKKMPEPIGYHEIVTLFSSIELCDYLHFYVSQIEHTPDYVAKLFKLSYKKIVSGMINLASENIKLILASEEDTEKCYSVPTGSLNTAAIAVKKLFSHVPFKKLTETAYVYILFDKRVPAGAGLGGGSSNAAAALKALNYLFGFNYSQELLMAISRRVGADVPFTLKGGGAAVAEGIGEKFISFFDFESWPLVIVYPNFEVSSRDAYSNVKNYIKYDLCGLDSSEESKVRAAALARAEKTAALMGEACFDNIGANIYNKLEEPVFARKHKIRDLKETLYGLGYKNVLMTGSGSAMYVLLNPRETPESLNDHFEKIQAEMYRKFSRTYKVILTKTKRAAAWEKMSL